MQGELDDATSALWNLRHLLSFRFCVTALRKRWGSPGSEVVMLAQPQGQGRGVLPRRRVAVGAELARQWGGAGGRAALHLGATCTSNGDPMHTIVGTRHRRASGAVCPLCGERNR
jgi:hypothetical protein